ncbi:MAG TPA: PQQ-binding-like beta-propeller repeat protein [Pirellulales bacterium]|nr:PQQ-binding-like beta-propeller repeat protein [Pirellulales bacterium]
MITTRRIARALLPLVLLLAGRIAMAADNWPEFRGPHGDGHADSAKLPLSWSETEHVRWKTAIHDRGWSSPVVWGDQIWLTTATQDGKQMYAMQLDRDSGAVVRDVLLFSPAEPAFCHPYNSYASCTPAIEKGRVYIHFGSYGTTAIDTASGKQIWTRDDLPCDHFRGPGSSPILWNNLLILTFDGADFQYLVGLDKKTGETVWRTDRHIHYDSDDGDYHKGFSTPTVIKLAGREQLISPSAGATIAYDPATGHELWRVQSGGMNAAARPLFGHGMAFATTAYQGYQLFAVRPDGSGDISDSHVAWKFAKSVPSRSSPVLIGDHLFMVADKGVASCIDAKTGEALWQKRLPGEYTASPIYASGRIYFFNEDGRSPVIAPEPKELHELALNKLDDGCMASPAVSGNALFLRTKTHLYRIEQ